ncbi:MAG: T9SS type A sorting domain-containing protein [Bacteroidales bacterium]
MTIKILNTLILLWLFSISLPAQTAGCTDPLASNYDSTAVHNDGSCVYPGARVDAIKTWLLPAVIPETSGLISWNQKIWTHNDDTDTNLYALDTADINNYQTFPLPDVINTDWEELAQDSGFIYLGDFGNNAGNREDLKILKIEKNSLWNQQPAIDTIAFTYEDQTDFHPKRSRNTDYDCEAMIITNDSIFLFTKEWKSKGTSLYVLPKTPGNHTAKLRDSLFVKGLITAATKIENKNLILLTGYQNYQPFLYLLYDYCGHDFFGGNKRKIRISSSFHQVEGITSTNGSDIIISNEKVSHMMISIDAKLQKLDISPYIANYLTSPPVTRDNPEGIRIYPNPASHFLCIDIPAKNTGAHYSLSRISGQTVLQGKLNHTTNSFPVDTLSAGFYILSIGIPEYFSEKIIIK